MSRDFAHSTSRSRSESDPVKDILNSIRYSVSGQNSAEIKNALEEQELVGKEIEKLQSSPEYSITEYKEQINGISNLLTAKLQCLHGMLHISNLEESFWELHNEIDTRATNLVEQEEAKQESSENSLNIQTLEYVRELSLECIHGVENNWNWILTLSKCLHVHLRNSANYHKYFHEIAESKKWMDAEFNIVENNFGCCEPFDFQDQKISRMTADIEALSMQLYHWQTKVDRLKQLSTKVLPIHLRLGGIKEKTPVKSLCNYKSGQIRIRENEDVFLLDNRDGTNWKVENGRGDEGHVPALSILIPGPDPEALFQSEALLQKLHHDGSRLIVICSQKISNYIEQVYPPDYTMEEGVKIREMLENIKKDSQYLLSIYQGEDQSQLKNHSFVSLDVKSVFSSDNSKKIGSLKKALEDLISGWKKFMNSKAKNEINSPIDPLQILSPDKIYSNENQCITHDLDVEILPNDNVFNTTYKQGKELKRKPVETNIDKLELKKNETPKFNERSTLEIFDSINKDILEEDPEFEAKLIIEEPIVKKYSPYTTKLNNKPQRLSSDSPKEISTVSNDHGLLLHFEDEEIDEDHMFTPICDDGHVEINISQAQIQMDPYFIIEQKVLDHGEKNIRIEKPNKHKDANKKINSSIHLENDNNPAEVNEKSKIELDIARKNIIASIVMNKNRPNENILVPQKEHTHQSNYKENTIDDRQQVIHIQAAENLELNKEYINKSKVNNEKKIIKLSHIKKEENNTKANEFKLENKSVESINQQININNADTVVNDNHKPYISKPKLSTNNAILVSEKVILSPDQCIVTHLNSLSHIDDVNISKDLINDNVIKKSEGKNKSKETIDNFENLILEGSKSNLPTSFHKNTELDQGIKEIMIENDLVDITGDQNINNTVLRDNEKLNEIKFIKKPSIKDQNIKLIDKNKILKENDQMVESEHITTLQTETITHEPFNNSIFKSDHLDIDKSSLINVITTSDIETTSENLKLNKSTELDQLEMARKNIIASIVMNKNNPNEHTLVFKKEEPNQYTVHSTIDDMQQVIHIQAAEDIEFNMDYDINKSKINNDEKIIKLPHIIKKVDDKNKKIKPNDNKLENKAVEKVILSSDESLVTHSDSLSHNDDMNMSKLVTHTKSNYMGVIASQDLLNDHKVNESGLKNKSEKKIETLKNSVLEDSKSNLQTSVHKSTEVDQGLKEIIIKNDLVDIVGDQNINNIVLRDNNKLNETKIIKKPLIKVRDTKLLDENKYLEENDKSKHITSIQTETLTNKPNNESIFKLDYLDIEKSSLKNVPTKSDIKTTLDNLTSNKITELEQGIQELNVTEKLTQINENQQISSFQINNQKLNQVIKKPSKLQEKNLLHTSTNDSKFITHSIKPDLNIDKDSIIEEAAKYNSAENHKPFTDCLNIKLPKTLLKLRLLEQKDYIVYQTSLLNENIDTIDAKIKTPNLNFTDKTIFEDGNKHIDEDIKDDKFVHTFNINVINKDFNESQKSHIDFTDSLTYEMKKLQTNSLISQKDQNVTESKLFSINNTIVNDENLIEYLDMPNVKLENDNKLIIKNTFDNIKRNESGISEIKITNFTDQIYIDNLPEQKEVTLFNINLKKQSVSSPPTSDKNLLEVKKIESNIEFDKSNFIQPDKTVSNFSFTLKKPNMAKEDTQKNIHDNSSPSEVNNKELNKLTTETSHSTVVIKNISNKEQIPDPHILISEGNIEKSILIKKPNITDNSCGEMQGVKIDYNVDQSLSSVSIGDIHISNITNVTKSDEPDQFSSSEYGERTTTTIFYDIGNSEPKNMNNQQVSSEYREYITTTNDSSEVKEKFEKNILEVKKVDSNQLNLSSQEIKSPKKSVASLVLSSNSNTPSPKPTINSTNLLNNEETSSFEKVTTFKQQVSSGRLQQSSALGLHTQFASDSTVEKVQAEQVLMAQREDSQTFTVESVYDPRSQKHISLDEAVKKGILQPSEGIYFNAVTKEMIPIQEAILKGHIKVGYTSKRMGRETTSSVGLITIKRLKESKQPYRIISMLNTKTGDTLSIDEAIAAGIFNADEGTFVDTDSGDKLLITEAIENDMVEVEYYGNAPEPEYVVKKYAVRAVVDLKNKTTLSYHDAIRRGIIDRETGAYCNNITREKIFIGDAIKKGYLKGRYVDNDEKVSDLEIDPTNTLVLEKQKFIKDNVVTAIGVISAFKGASAKK